jgi:uncharacterized repeat protein (TIGR02543 family)
MNSINQLKMKTIMKTLHTIYMNFAKRFAIVLFFLTTLGLSSAWAALEYTEKFTITSDKVIDNTPYRKYEYTIEEPNWIITHGGNNKSVGTNEAYRSNCNLSNYSKYAVSPITTSDVASAFVNTTPINNISKISYTVGGGKNQSSTQVYLIYSTDGVNFSQMPLTSDNQGANISSGVEFTFPECSGYFGLLFKATNTSGDWRIDNVNVTFYGLAAPVTYHDVTWKVNGEAYTAGNPTTSVADNSRVSVLPTSPTIDCNGKTFVGWSVSEVNDGNNPNNIFTEVSTSPLIKSNTIFHAVFADSDGTGPTTITDILTSTTTGVSSTSYTAWSNKKASSSAVYAGNSGTEDNSIKINDDYGIGIVTTTSGGKAKTIEVVWNEDKTFSPGNERKLHIYGKHTAYTSAADLEDSNKSGELIGTLDRYADGGPETTLTINSDYEYIAFDSPTGALYFKSISITWYSESNFTGGYTTSCSNDVTVTLNPNGGTGDFTEDWIPDGSKYTQTVKKGNSVTLPTLNDQIAYTFGGWSDGNAVIPAGDYTPEKDIELTAVWTARPLTNYRTSCTYTVTWQANGGLWNDGKTEDIVNEYNIGDAIIKPTDPKREGYRFLGWSEDGATIVDPKTTMPAENLTYIAVWEEEYSVTYNPNGGNTTCVDNNAYIKGEIVTVCATQPTKTGYTFAGWNDGTNTYQAGNTFIMPAGDVTLTAQWTANTNTAYKVEHYQQNVDDTYPTTPYETDALTGTTDATVTPLVKTYEGFTSPATQTVKIAADGSLVVRYEYTRNSYQLTWDLAGGSITAAGTAAGSVKYGAQLTAPKLERVGYTFVGWDPAVPATMPATDVTYTAIWENCRWVETDIKQIDPTEEVVVAMKKKGHVYALDYSNGTGGYPPAREVTVSGTEITSTITDKIKWNISGNATDGYILYPNGDNTRWLYCTKSSNTVRVGENTTDNLFTIDNGYLKHTNTAEAWQGYVGVSFNTSPYSWRHYPSSDNSVINGQTLKFYTRLCLEDNQHWINYQLSNVNCTSSPVPVYVTEGDASLNLTFAAEEGFTLPATVAVTMDGNPIKFTWEDGKLNIPAPPTGFNADVTITITAVHTVTFDMQGHGTQVAPQAVAHQAKATQPTPAPTATGYTFGGWYKDNACTKAYDFATPVEENITLYAKWTANTYTVTWNPDGGYWPDHSGNKVDNYNYGDPIVKPADPEKSGYVFDGWDAEIATTMPSNNLTYTAKWKEAYCDNYSFHWGTGTDDFVKNNNRQACFVQKGNTTEWQVEKFEIPSDTKYFVGNRGYWYQDNLGSGGSHSVIKEWTWTGDQVFYLALVGRGYTVGHAVGAVGTLRIYDDTWYDNLDVAFIPNGYGITLTSNSSGAKTPYAFRTTTVDHKWETDVLKLPGITNNKYTVGLATQVDGEYVASNHSKAPENLEKMGVTEVVAGKKMIYLKPNTDWKKDGARFAAYFFGNGEKWISMTDPDGDGIYECERPNGYTQVIFCRMNGGSTTNAWSNKWNQTQDIALPANDGLAKLYTITGWDNSCTGPTNMQPKTGTNGKFRMWDNSTNKNWFVHFVPYYLLSYDANGGEGEMPATEYNTEDADRKVTVSANGFTRTGYDFVSWNTKEDGKGTSYQPGATYTMTGDATLYAIWKAQTYNITYKDQGDDEYSGENLASLPTTHTYDKKTTLVDGVKTGYTFEGWYDTPECDGTPIKELGAQDYTADITLYAKWTFAMEYNITNTETIYITSAKKQTVKATTQLTLQVGNMPVGTTIDIAAPHITFYDDAGKPVTQLTTKYNPETFSLAVAYTPEDENTTEQPTITLSVLGHEKAFDIISARSLPATFAIVAKVGSMWYALPSQGLSSTNDLMGYPVEVDNQDDPTLVAYVPENADWSLRQVYKSTGTDDRFGANGDNILFVNGEDNALNASRTEGYVLTEAGYGGYQTTTSPDLYEWTPTTTDLETYQVTNAYRTDRKLSIDILTRFGIYKGEIENLRFLPIQGRYTQATFQVVEWKENSVVIMYNGNPDQQATLAINGVKVGSAQLRAAEKDFAVYELPANGLVNQPTQRLLITIGSEQKWLTIPYIISGEKTDAEVVAATSAEIATATDVFILKDAKFTATATSKNNQYRFRNVTIYGGGKLVIGSGKYLSMNSIILRAGGITAAGEYDYVYPQFDLQGTLTNSAGEFKYDYITDYEHWFHLVLPFDGKIKSPSIKYPVEFYGNNVSATNSGSWVVKRYDGATRATGNYEAWVDIETEGKDIITAGHGYIYWGAPKKVKVNGEEKRQKWGIQRIVMKKGWEDARNAEIGNKTVSGLGSYANVDNNSGNVYDQGWNLIGNPYMVNLTGLNSRSLKAGQLIEELNANGNWTGGWVLDSINATLRYITVPSDHFEWYEAKRVSKDMKLVAGRAFFVQIDGTATDVMFEAANRAQLMPALLAENNNNPVDIETGIVLSNETLQDEVNFWIADGMTNDYEYNADYPKTPNTNNFNIYGVHTHGHLSWVAISPEIAAESMPIGYQVPAAGTYVLSVSEEYYSEEIDALLVTDHEASPEVTTDLMIAPYEFSVNQAETNNKRFTVSVKLKTDDSNDATGLDNMGVGNEQLMKFIYQDKIFILHQGVIYDATGKRVITINK